MTYAVVAGCSHTAGTGLSGLNYVDYLDQHYDYTIENHGLGGAGAEHVVQSIVDNVQRSPEFILAQWPNPFRRTLWMDKKPVLENINYSSDVFKLLVKYGEANFYNPWLQSIILGNLLCKGFKVPIINIMFESVGQEYLTQLATHNIHLHIDEKQPGKTWLFDSAADDKLHHSTSCHQQWAKRIIGIINESTTR